MRGALFLLLFLSMLPPALSAAHAGVMFYVWVSLIAPNVFVFGFLEQVPYSKIAIIVAVLAIIGDKARKTAYLDSYYIFMIAFFAQCAISVVFSLTTTDQHYLVADRVWKIALLCLLMNPVLRGRLQIHSIVLVIGIAMGVQGAMEGLKYLASGGGHIMQPPGNFGDNNSFGLLVLLNVPLLMYLFRYTLNPYVRLAFFGGVLVNVLAIIGTGSRGAFLGIVAVALGTIVQSKHRFTTLLAVAIVGGAVAGFVPSKVFQRVDTIQTAEADDSFLGRVRAWKLNTLVALDRPLTGGGFSAMEDLSVWTAYLPKFSSMDFIDTGPPDRPRAAHSIFFQTLGDTGFIGLFLYLSILTTSFLSLRNIRQLSVADASLGWAYDLAGYLRLTLIAFVLSGALLSVVYYELPFIVFTLVSVLRRTVLDELTAQAAQPASGSRDRPGQKTPGVFERPKLVRHA